MQHTAFHLVAAAGSVDAKGCKRFREQQHRHRLTGLGSGGYQSTEISQKHNPLSGQLHSSAVRRSTPTSSSQICQLTTVGWMYQTCLLHAIAELLSNANQ